MTEEHLNNWKITSTGFIDLKPNCEERIAVTASLGQNELWSSANLYRQLSLLESLVPRMVCNDLSIFVLLTCHFRLQQAPMHGLMCSSSVHLQYYHKISTWFSTWNMLSQPLLLAH